MANRLTYRKILRKLHLISSMVLFAFLLMYFVTAFILIRHNWFPQSKPEVTEQIVPFKINPETTDFKALTEPIKEYLNITGRTDVPFQRKDSCWIYNVYRPGINQHIVLNKEKQNLTVTTNKQLTLVRISSRLHLMRHYKGGPLYYIWAFLYDLAAVSMLVFGISGILIWFKMKKTYKNGVYYLLSGITISSAVFIYLVM